MTNKPTEILAQLPDEEIQDLASFLSDADQDRLWRSVNEARNQ